MKYIKLTAWGNKKTHMIPIKAIADLEFDDNYTIIRLSNGNVLNVIEDELTLSTMLDQLGVQIVSEFNLDIDELPF